MAKGLGHITVGIKMQEPNWPLLCMGLAADVSEALAYLEKGDKFRATEVLSHAKGKVQMAFMCEHSERKPKDYQDKGCL